MTKKLEELFLELKQTINSQKIPAYEKLDMLNVVNKIIKEVEDKL